MDSIEAGSIVQLKSGGPAMTVVSADSAGVHCIWYGEVNDDVKNATIPALALVAVTASDEEEDDDDDD
jgi:uncharacterized protein YodC (DUF2158 family)